MPRSVDSTTPHPSTRDDVVIVGGGVMGAALACFLARDHRAQVTVLERDPMYRRASSALSASSIRQQFSTRANIELSAWSVRFLRRVADELAVPGQVPPSIGLVEPGYLYLVPPAGLQTLQQNHEVQRSVGADVVLMSAAELQERFAWMRVEGVAAGSWGRSGEGWFDGPALHQAFRAKAQACGARFLQAEAAGFACSTGGTVQAVITRDGRHHAAGAFVLAAGAWTAALAAELGVKLPVAARKRDVFVLDSPAAPLAGCPLVIDPSGVWFRPEGRGFLAGAPPRPEHCGGPGDPDEPSLDDIDHALFDEVIWPALAHRVPGFEALRVRSAWAGYYEMNTFDHNGLVGPLPGWRNVHTVCGFSGHGMQQAPAVACAMAARLAGRQHSDAPDVAALDPQRIALQRPLLERNVI